MNFAYRIISMKTLMEELKRMLEGVCDTYTDFVTGVLVSTKGNEEKQKKMIEFIKTHPNATSSEIIEYLDLLEGIGGQ